MNHSTSTTNSRQATAAGSRLARPAAAVAAIALTAAACGGQSSGEQAGSTAGTDEVSTAATTAPTDESPSTTAAATTVDDSAGDGATSAASTAEASQVGAEITMTAVTDFQTDTGDFEVAAGADDLGCDGGSFTDEYLAESVERVFTCESGERSGTFSVHFQPEMGDSGQFTSDWNVAGATGDFAGLEGGGEWVGILDDDEAGATDTWTGGVVFGAADETVSASELPSPEDDLQAYLAARVDGLRVPDDAGVVMAVVFDGDGNRAVGAGGMHPDGSEPTPDDPVRVGSITKVFTALTTLALVDDGLLGLDDPVSDHLASAVVPAGVTVRDLLQHTSGIPDITAVDRFFDELIDDRSRRWTPQDVLDIVADRAPDFAPGEEHAYSNTNYIVLGLLVEELTGQPAHDVIREQVIEPAGLQTTYLDGAEDGPAPVQGYSDFGVDELAPIEFDYTSQATAAWTAGAMVSTPADLHRLFLAVEAGAVVSDEMRAELTANEGYGLGTQPWEMSDVLVGHGGDIAGSHTLVFHAPESGQTAFWVSTSDGLFFEPLVEDVVHAMVPELAERVGES